MYAPLLPDVRHFPHPSTLTRDDPDEDGVAVALAAARESVANPYGGVANPAGIWVECVQGEGGVVSAPEGFLTGLQEIANDNGIPLVVDEIQTGLGRTGKWFASEWYDIEPDVMPMAKALDGAGFPLSATMYGESFDVLEPGDHTGTFRGFLPAIQAGLAAIAYVEHHNLLAHVRNVGERIRTRLEDAAESNDSVHEVRGKGFMLGVEFAEDEGATPKELVRRVRRRCLELGVVV